MNIFIVYIYDNFRILFVVEYSVKNEKLASKSGVLEYDYGNTPSSIDTASRSRIPIPPTMPERSITGEDDSASVSQGRGSELGGWDESAARNIVLLQLKRDT